MFYTNCPQCSMQMTDDGGLSGQTVMCPHCHGQFVMPAMQASPVAANLPPTIDSAPSRGKYDPRGDLDDFFSNPSKNPGLAAILSFFYVGLGQIYNGQIAKGIILCLVPVLVGAFILAAYLGIGVSIASHDSTQQVLHPTIVISGERHYLDELPSSEFERLPPDIQQAANRQLETFERQLEQARDSDATRGVAWAGGFVLLYVGIGVAMFGIWIFGTFDAYSTAERINNRAQRRRRRG